MTQEKEVFFLKKMLFVLNPCAGKKRANVRLSVTPPALQA